MPSAMPPSRPAAGAVPASGGQYKVALALVTSLFFMWAINVNMNDILIPHLKKACDLTDLQSSLIQTAFFGGYFLMALPAGWLMQRFGYKAGILAGLMLCATGAFLFFPAAETRLYGFFLFALFVMACGNTILETAANPYVSVLGKPEHSDQRLNLAQSFNALGAVVTPLLGSAFILTGNELDTGQLAQMTAEAVEAYRVSEADTVKLPYLTIGGVFVLIALLFFFAPLPEVKAQEEEGGSTTGIAGLLHHRHLVLGVVAQFCYVGAQVGVASFLIRLMQFTVPGTPEKVAATYLTYHLIGFMLGRFIGTALMQRIAPPRLLALFAIAATALTLLIVGSGGMVAVWAVVLIGFFNSIMFPTIFSLSIKNLGEQTKTASSLLVMSIVGGAILPALMGFISDQSNIQWAFLMPAICYVYVLFFALRGYRTAN